MAFTKELLRTLRKCFGFGKGRTAAAVKTETVVPATAVKTEIEVPATENQEAATSAEVDQEPLSISGEVESTGDKKPATEHNEGQLVSQASWGKWERKVSAGQEIFTIGHKFKMDGKDFFVTSGVRGGGDCLFNAMSHVFTGHQGKYMAVRRGVSQHILAHRADYEEVVHNKVLGGGLPKFVQTVEDYACWIGRARVSGDDTTLRALIFRYECRIALYQKVPGGGVTQTCLYDYTYPESWPVVHLWFEPPSRICDELVGHYELVLVRDLGEWRNPWWYDPINRVGRQENHTGRRANPFGELDKKYDEQRFIPRRR
ncbi:hypothetical protein HK097_003127 [Rhizophlyctis rosea]|uniref:OTU domain-containing protein n=1 Tax=Rhizophlyctis rosea TaxID=64517 RepID=A0AAD5X0S6_9FUNG|nr:hypothetical protein HK097_003127 [Rhizophlyctis rosea]